MPAHDDSDSDAFLEVMRDTRSRYVAGFADQLDRLRELVSAEPTGERLAALGTLAHRMAGLSGTVGFRDVATHASELESLVDTSRAGSALDAARALAIIESISDAFTRGLASPPEWAVAVQPVEGRPRVLIVEDDEDQRALMRSCLESAAFATTGVSSGSDAIEAARRERPALILLDVHLPDRDGYSVCRQLKADKETRGIPIVFVTTRAALNERLAGLALGADDYLPKPIDMNELLLRARRLTAPRARAEPIAHDGPIRRYEDWLDAARAALDAGATAMAMVRTAENRQRMVASHLSENLRRRDLITAYDRTHLLVLIPGAAAPRALETIAEALAGLDGEAIHAGVASASLVSPDVLISEADDALASARHTGERVSLRRTAPDGPARGDARSVLLADDDPDVMRILDAYMRSLGFTTTLAFDGRAAAAGLASHPDVVVLDLMMPKMTGFEVMQQMSELGGARPKTIVLSARGREDDVTRAFDLGADDYMVKPFSPQELGARIGRLLR